MFERFTDKARLVLVFAQEEARALERDFLGTEHILLGLLKERAGVAGRALLDLGLDVAGVRRRVEELVGSGAGSGRPSGAPPFTPRSKKVLELSLRVALDRGDHHIDTEHLLLGLLREGEGVAAQVLVASGLSLEAVRDKVLSMLSVQPPWPEVRYGSMKTTATPAGSRLQGRADVLAGENPTGTQHYLLAIFEEPGSLAAGVLRSVGVTREAVEDRIAAMGTVGTTDAVTALPPTPVVSITLGEGVTLRMDDPAFVAEVRSAVEATGADPEPAELGRLMRRALSDWLKGTGEPGPPPGDPG